MRMNNLSYGHHDFVAAFSEKELNREVTKLNRLIGQGRIPISNRNVQKIPWNKRLKSYEALVSEHSEKADLVIMGFSINKIIEEKGEFFKRFEKVNDILFVRAGRRIAIEDDFSEEPVNKKSGNRNSTEKPQK